MNALRNLTVKPQIEVLEDRYVPATATLAASGDLYVVGTDAAETIRVTQSSSQIAVQGAGSFSAASVRSVVVEGKHGDDTIDLRTVRVPATVYAGAGNDFIVGTLGNDYVLGQDGNDRLFGMAGNDTLDGGTGNDRLFGMTGYDALYGQDGDDFLDDGNRTSQEVADGGYGMDWNADVVAVAGTTMNDVIQHGAPTCGYLSTLAGLARTGTDYTRWIRYAGFTSEGMPQYDVAFWKGSWTWTRVNFNGSTTWNDPGSAAEGESWTILLQRGWIKFQARGGACWPHEAIYALAGKSASYRYSVAGTDYNRIANALAANKLVMTSTIAAPQSKLIASHAYTVTEVWGTGTNLWVQVRNPWGYDGGGTPYGDANDGLVWLTWSEFQYNMRYLAIA